MIQVHIYAAALKMHFSLVRSEGVGSFGWCYIVLHLCL